MKWSIGECPQSCDLDETNRYRKLDKCRFVQRNEVPLVENYEG